jgi:hypothetical protein
MKKTKVDTMTIREALYIYFSLADVLVFTFQKTIRECYNIELPQLRGLVAKCISEAASIQSKKHNISFAESFEQILKKQMDLAKFNLLEEDKVKWINCLNRQETFLLDKLLLDEVDRLRRIPALTGFFGAQFEHIKFDLAQIAKTQDYDQEKFLQYRIKFIIDNIMGRDKNDTVNILDELKRKVKNVSKVASWYFKEIVSNSPVFTDWFQAYINKNPIPNSIAAFHTEGSLLPNTAFPLPEFQTTKYDIDYWLFKFSTNYSIHNSFLELYLRTMKGAWSQKKYRDSNNGKKACSFQLDKKTIKLLDDLCKTHKRNKNEMIEILIEDACEEDGIIKRPNRR